METQNTIKTPYRIQFGTNQVAIYGYSPNKDSHRVAQEFIQRGYHVRLVNPKRRGEQHLGRTVIPSVHSIKDPFFVTVYRDPAKAISDGAVHSFMDTAPRGVIVNPLGGNQSYLKEHRDELIESLQRIGINTIDECSFDGLETRVVPRA